MSESAARAGLGAQLDLDAVPLREPAMEAFEILTSESQERMLAIVHPSKLDAVQAVCDRWGLRTAVIAELAKGATSPSGTEVRSSPRCLPRSLTDEGPEYDRPWGATNAVNGDDPTFVPFDGDLARRS